jgi:hypothetical protein
MLHIFNVVQRYGRTHEQIGHAFVLDSPDLYAHHLALDAIQVLVGFLSDATTLRPLGR